MLAFFIIGAGLGFAVGVWVGGWRAVVRISQVAHRDLMKKANLRKR